MKSISAYRMLKQSKMFDRATLRRMKKILRRARIMVNTTDQGVWR